MKVTTPCYHTLASNPATLQCFISLNTLSPPKSMAHLVPARQIQFCSSASKELFFLFSLNCFFFSIIFILVDLNCYFILYLYFFIFLFCSCASKKLFYNFHYCYFIFFKLFFFSIIIILVDLNSYFILYLYFFYCY